MVNDKIVKFSTANPVKELIAMFKGFTGLEQIAEPLYLLSSQTHWATFYEFLSRRIGDEFALGGGSPSRIQGPDCAGRQTIRYVVKSGRIFITYTIPVTLRRLEDPETKVVIHSAFMTAVLNPTDPYSGQIAYSLNLSGLLREMKAAIGTIPANATVAYLKYIEQTMRDTHLQLMITLYLLVRFGKKPQELNERELNEHLEPMKRPTKGPINIYEHGHLLRGGTARKRTARKKNKMFT